MDDWLAVVLSAGKGNRMPALTEHIPKALLPVANLPLYWFPLNMLQRNGIKECILIVPKLEKAGIKQTLDDGTILPLLKCLNIEIISLNDDEVGGGEGTADVIRQLLAMHKLNKENILLVSGDFISNFSLEGMLKLHEERKSMFTCLLTDSILGGAVPGSKDRAKKYKDLVALSPQSNQLLYMLDEEDYGEDENLPKSLFRSCSQVLMTTKYKDVHLYAVRKKALKILSKQNSYSSLKADFVPNLLKCQFSKSKQKSLGIVEPFKCFAYICTKNDCSMLAHCNHIGAYFEANKTVQKLLLPGLTSRKFEKATGVISSDSLISENSKIGEKCQIKRSVVGDRCEVGQNVKIDNSVLMSGITVENGVSIKNSIIFQNAILGEKCDLAMCIVAPGKKVGPKLKLSHATIADEREMDLGDFASQSAADLPP